MMQLLRKVANTLEEIQEVQKTILSKLKWHLSCFFYLH